MESVLRELERLLKHAKSVTVLTGAGISAESGVPTFRADGKAIPWGGYPDPTVLSHVDALDRDIAEVWRWYGYRRQLVRQCQPNPGHVALADWQRRLPRFTLVTQNVDGLHQRSGSANVVELHGNIWRAFCLGCGRHENQSEAPDSEDPPRCACDSFYRPAVIMFGEPLDPRSIAAAQAATGCDVFVAIGTSGVVWPAAKLPLDAKRKGARLVEINPEVTTLTDEADLVIHGPAGEILPKILKG